MIIIIIIFLPYLIGDMDGWGYASTSPFHGVQGHQRQWAKAETAQETTQTQRPPRLYEDVSERVNKALPSTH